MYLVITICCTEGRVLLYYYSDIFGYYYMLYRGKGFTILYHLLYYYSDIFSYYNMLYRGKGFTI